MFQNNINNGTTAISTLLNEANGSKFLTEKWDIVNDNLKSNEDAPNEISYNTEFLKSNLCDYNNTCILVRGNFTVTAAPATQVGFKNCAPFTKCITKIDDAEDLDSFMPMYNLIGNS